MRSNCRAAQIAAIFALVCAPAWGQPEAGLPAQLDFEAGDGCPSATSFVARVNARAAMRLVDTDPALRLRVSLSSEPGHARGVLGTGPAGSSDAREVTAASCEEVADALALITALLVERTKRAQKAMPTPEAKTAEKPPPPTPAPLPLPKLAQRQVMLGAEGLVSRPITNVAMAGGGATLLVDASLSWWLSVAYARSDLLRTARTGRFALGSATVGIGPAALHLSSKVAWASALAGQAAFIEAQGVGVDVSTSARRSEWSLGLLSRISGEVVSGGMLFVELGGFVPFVKRRFNTEQPHTLVGETTLVSPQLGLGFELAL